MLLTARHPDLFVVAGSFSGFVDQLTPRGIAVIDAFTAVDSLGCGNDEGLDAIWGDPVLDRANWTAHDPTDLATRLRGTVLYIASGNGLNCPDDPQPDSLEAGLVQENTVDEMSHNLADALTRDEIPHTEDFYGCGTHIARYIQRDLHVFWPIFARAVTNPDA
jgi:diacylglycerol O-acyltransferase/trehalose O-mycolyltransferase